VRAPLKDIAQAVLDQGFARLLGPETLALLGSRAAADWTAFARSWDDLGQDLYMADGGRYRRRRHAHFSLTNGVVTRLPHQPHFQSRDYNPLNGDVQRWFQPVTEATEANDVTTAIFGLCASLLGLVSGRPADQAWRCEVHQFRIEAKPEAVGRPTPEGLHRDGVDWVLVMLVDRRNVAEGATEIGAPDGRQLGRFTLAEPGDAIFLDDHRILHGVTPIVPIDPALPARRDALVVTFRTEET
jgi:hypothetical protein